jgi:hypothetical protein
MIDVGGQADIGPMLPVQQMPELVFFPATYIGIQIEQGISKTSVIASVYSSIRKVIIAVWNTKKEKIKGYGLLSMQLHR